MAIEYPDISKVDFSVNGNENEDAKKILDFSYNYWNSDNKRKKKVKKLYDYFNGFINENNTKYLTHITGTKSKVPFRRYMLGRSKLKLLLGEFLRIGMNPTASAINPEAQNEKVKKYKELLGLSHAKPYIEEARKMGYDIFPGMEIPDKDDKKIFHENNFKILNEIVMQHIINDKVATEELLAKFYSIFTDAIICSEMHGVVYRNEEGIDTLRRVNPYNALFIKQDNDPFLRRSPYRGEVHYMHYHEILNEFKLTDEQKKQLANIRIHGGHGAVREEDGNTDFLIPVVRLEWIANAPVRTKISNHKVPYKNVLSYDYYNKNKDKIEREVKKGKYKLDTKFKMTLWKGCRISDIIYTGIEEKESVIQQLDQNGKARPRYDYFSLLFGDVNGTAVSMQELMTNLEDSYDEVRYIIRKEISKVKGKNIVFDRAFTGDKLYKDIVRDITEEGLIEINSASDSNYGLENIVGRIKPVETIDLGPSSALPALINVAIDIERTMDRITGLNDDRQGITKATTTATTNNNNLAASQSMTYDLFFFSNMLVNEALTKLAEKTKLNWAFFGEDGRMIPYGNETIKYIKATKNLTSDDYSVVINDGRKEFEIRQKSESLLNAQVNAGLLGTETAIEFWSTKSLGEALNVLERAAERQKEWERENRDAALEMEKAKEENRYRMALEDREDKQEHDINLEEKKIQGKERIESLKLRGKAAIDKQNNVDQNNISIQQEQTKNLLNA